MKRINTLLLLITTVLMAASTCFGQDVKTPPVDTVPVYTHTGEVDWVKPLVANTDSRWLSLVPVQPQQVDRWCIGNFCVDATAPVGSAVVTVTPPTRAGKLALLSDIVAGPAPAAWEVRGTRPFVNGTVTVPLTGFTVVPICMAYDPSGNSVKITSVTTTSVTMAGVGPSVSFSCK